MSRFCYEYLSTYVQIKNIYLSIIYFLEQFALFNGVEALGLLLSICVNKTNQIH